MRGLLSLFIIAGSFFYSSVLNNVDAQTSTGARVETPLEAGSSAAPADGGVAIPASDIGTVATTATAIPRDTGSVPVPAPAPVPVEPKSAETSAPSAFLPDEEPDYTIHTDEHPADEEESGIHPFWLAGALAGFAVLMFAYGIRQIFRGNLSDQKNTEDDKKCDDIKALLEQKKKEFEEMVRSWPEEKLKEMAKEKVLGEIKKNETAKNIVETAEDVKAKYDKLKNTIELLQTKYDLCMLKFPPLGSKKIILADAVGCFVADTGGGFKIFKEMHDLLETYKNRKIILTGADDAQFRESCLDKMPYEVFTLKHNPEKIDPKYFEEMLKHFELKNTDVIYFEHDPNAVKSAQSIGITSYHYDNAKKDLAALKEFLDKNI